MPGTGGRRAALGEPGGWPAYSCAGCRPWLSEVSSADERAGGRGRGELVATELDLTGSAEWSRSCKILSGSVLSTQPNPARVRALPRLVLSSGCQLVHGRRRPTRRAPARSASPVLHVVESNRSLSHARSQSRARTTELHSQPTAAARPSLYQRAPSPAESSCSAPPRPSSRRDEALDVSRCCERESAGRRAGRQPASEEGRQGQLWSGEWKGAREEGRTAGACFQLAWLGEFIGKMLASWSTCRGEGSEAVEKELVGRPR